MTDSMLPIIRQMLDAGDDRERARVLLAVSDAVLLKYREQFEACCRRVRFEMGLEFIQVRRAAWHAVRGPDGRHIKPIFETVRAAMASFAGVIGEDGGTARPSVLPDISPTRGEIGSGPVAASSTSATGKGEQP